MKGYTFVATLILSLVLFSLSLSAQNYLVPCSGDTTIIACGGHVYDPGGPNNSYATGCDGYIIIYPTNTWGRVQLIGTYDIGSSDYVEILDGAGLGGILLERCVAQGNVSVTSMSGPITIRFNSTASWYNYGNTGFDFAIWCFGGRCGSFGPQVSLTPNEEGVLVSWPLS
ncbi:MAG: hypothetical protein IJT04_07600, partial [Bacteroidales bacterium]|nr:hypothetical protein [Bacteroidales bacterium]